MRKLLIPMLLLILIVSGCGNAEESTTTAETDNAATEEKMDIYTTVYPLTYFTERIGGERVNVQSIYPAGANEHTFEPTQKDMIALADADAVFYIGLGLEGFIDSAKQTLSNENVEFVATAESIPEAELGEGHTDEEGTEEEHDHAREEGTEEEHDHANEEGTEGEHDHGHEEGTEEEHDHAHEEGTEEEHDHANEEGTEEEHDHEHETGTEEEHDHEHEAGTEEEHDHAHEVDPHVWISPVLSQQLAESIKDELIERDGENAEEYEANYEQLIEELKVLDQSFNEMAAAAEQKAFFVSHSAFGYWADAYDLEQVAVAGLNSQDEPSQQALVNIVKQAEELNIDYIAFEQNVSSRLTEVIQKEVGAEAVQLHNLSVLTQEEIDAGETYFSLMEKNLEVMEKIMQ
ncbi:metal ABC transporter solute-binding protein, Zn/Mn family [Planococcus halotolerans]|uniref:metal ABC transporter solute-binding protein, Zn/Mn family n=1 Tax=Planococcus halotolerans TaxID=2233542 RepID=UPI001092E199|nr:zinc ABC transporter substrate-binding protein [Planococcus halotolerans]QHJ70036.1 zinc ABC transporter solute-binding protein [Planococcus halotolerans]